MASTAPTRAVLDVETAPLLTDAGPALVPATFTGRIPARLRSDRGDTEGRIGQTSLAASGSDAGSRRGRVNQPRGSVLAV